MDFGNLWALNLTLDIWPWFNVMAHLVSWTTIAWNIIQILHGSKELWLGHRFWVCIHYDLDLGSRSWHTLGSWIIIVWNIIQILDGSKELWPGHRFWVCMHCGLDLGYMTLAQGHDTSFGHGQQLCEIKILSRSSMAVRSLDPDTNFGYMYTVNMTLKILPRYKVIHDKLLAQGHDTSLGHRQQSSIILSRSNMAVRSYDLDMDFGYVYTMSLTSDIWPLFNAMANPWVIDNNCVDFFSESNMAVRSYGLDKNLGYLCSVTLTLGIWP